MIHRRALAAALALPFAPAALRAEDFPARPLRIVVTVAAGATNDIMARLFAERMGRNLGQPVVVENRGGGAGLIATQLVKDAPPDGYTMLLANTSVMAINPNLFRQLPYNPLTDFAPVTVLATSPSVLVVNSDLPVKNVAELVQYLRTRPGEYAFASAGNGTPMHLSGELFRQQAQVQMTHVPFRGSAPALAELMAGRVQLMFDNVPAVLSHIRSGTVRALATTGSSREPLLPDVPTMAEAGFQGAESTSWFGLVTPRGTPGPIVARLNASALGALSDPELREKLASLAAKPWGSTPEEMTEHMRREIEKWRPIVKASGATVD
ncbi:Bug family tripartite tricarboxylate transporter substrate binding protein [Roseomonas chloroacetimidivorans]|uniref:Bug family tripartite tricarboxylate transporter substrate binding protein n=1 Tax=Roseomonas chloroacetimidivorans TaxID=1766656 RepID=UPI003C77F68C